MRTLLALWTLTLTLGISSTTQAGPIVKGSVPPDAGWIAHLDLDRLQGSKLGATLIKTFIEPKALEMSDALSSSFGIDLDWRRIHSITAYGKQLAKNPEKDAVLLVQSDLPLQATFDQLTAAFKGNGAGAKGLALTRSQIDGFELLAFNQDAYLSLATTNLLVLGKTKEAVTRALSQLKNPTAPGGKTSLMDESSGTELPLAWVAARGTLADGLELPPQAQVLKKTDGLRLSVSEVTEDLLAKLTFKTKTVEVVEQLQQALQGILALATLGTSEDKRAQQLLKGIRVERKDQDVEVGIRMPLAEVSKWIEPKAKKQRAARQ